MIEWREKQDIINGVASPSEAQDDNGSKIKGLDCFVQETFEVSKALCFSSKKFWYAGGGKVAMAASSCYESKKGKVNAKYFANSNIWHFL